MIQRRSSKQGAPSSQANRTKGNPTARGVTLVEACIALSVFSLLLIGVLGTLLQSRRLAAASVAQNCAVSIVQGYIEQLKNIPLQQFVNASPTDQQNNPNLTSSFVLQTMQDPTTTAESGIRLATTPSTVAVSTLTGATPGVTPAGVVDNLQTFDMNSQASDPTTTWSAIWPGANTSLTPYPSTTPRVTDLRMNFWVHISDLTPTATPRCKAYGLVIVYTWQYLDGNRIKYNSATVRTIRSAVQTF